MSKNSYIDISERRLLLRIIDVMMIFLSIWFASTYFNFTYVEVQKALFSQWFFVLATFFLLFGEIFQLYNLRVSNNTFLIVKSVAITTFVTTIAYILFPFVTPSLPNNRLQIIYLFLLIAIPVIIWRFLYMFLLFSPKYFKTVIVIGHTSRAKSMLNLIEQKNYHNVAAYFSNDVINGFKDFYDIKNADLISMVRENHVKEIVVSTKGFSSEVVSDLNKQLILLFEEGINIKSFETYYEEVTNRVPKEYLDHNFYKNINFSKNNDKQLYLFVRRIIDILISTIGLLLLVCLLPIFLIGNLIGNRGPLFYFQERVGEKGKTFKIVKLRSMIPDAERNGAVWAQKNDIRITAFGKFLRNTRLDEIPQFYNVLKGEMSFIGPRPERPNFVKELSEKIPFYSIRHVIKPGLTGWAQVNYPYASTLEEQEMKLYYDLYYIKERSYFLDFKILIKTISTVLLYRGQ